MWCGVEIFKPQPGRGKFLPLTALRPDDRCKPDDRCVEKPQSNNGKALSLFCTSICNSMGLL